MGQKAFTQINSSILTCKKLRQCNHEEKWAYLCAHLSPLGSYTGQFEYPLVMWQRDAQVADIEPVIGRLSEVVLIQFDSDEEFVRISESEFRRRVYAIRAGGKLTENMNAEELTAAFAVADQELKECCDDD